MSLPDHCQMLIEWRSVFHFLRCVIISTYCFISLIAERQFKLPNTCLFIIFSSMLMLNSCMLLDDIILLEFVTASFGSWFEGTSAKVLVGNCWNSFYCLLFYLFIYLFIGLLVVVSFDSNLGGGGFKRISDLNSNQNTINNKQSEEWMLCALFLNSDCLFLHFLWISEFSSFSRSRKLWEGSRLRLHIVGICAESTVFLV